VALETRDYRSW